MTIADSKKYNRKALSLNAFLTGSMFYLPVLTMFYQNIGLSPQVAFIIVSFYGLTKFLFEVPTGVFADRISPALSVKLGYVFKLIYILFVITAYFGRSPWEVVILMFVGTAFFSIGETLISGANTTVLHESTDTEHAFSLLSSRLTTLFAAGIISSSLAAGFLYSHSPIAPFLATGIAFTLAVLMVIPLKDISQERHKSYRKVIKGSLQTITQSKALMALFIYSAIVFAVGMLFTWHAQIFYTNRLLLPTTYYGFINVGFIVFLIVGSHLAHRFYQTLKAEKILGVIAGFTLLGYSSLIIFNNLGGLLTAGAFIYLAKGISIPALSVFLNQLIPDNRVRSTCISICSQFEALCYAVLISVSSFLVLKHEWLLDIFIFFLLGIAFCMIPKFQRENLKVIPLSLNSLSVEKGPI